MGLNWPQKQDHSGLTRFGPIFGAKLALFILQCTKNFTLNFPSSHCSVSNKAPGFDKISARVIKDGLSVILWPITHVINASLTNGVFPGGWKQAEVTPIPKEGDHEQPCNNRPILLLPVLSKVCERIALNQLTAYLTTNNRLSAKQSGNKNFYSTETALIRSTDAILTGMDKQELSAMILLDMSKAFDSINHDILL